MIIYNDIDCMDKSKFVVHSVKGNNLINGIKLNWLITGSPHQPRLETLRQQSSQIYELITIIVAQSDDPVCEHECHLKKWKDHMGHKLAHSHLAVVALHTFYFFFCF